MFPILTAMMTLSQPALAGSPSGDRMIGLESLTSAAISVDGHGSCRESSLPVAPPKPPEAGDRWTGRSGYAMRYVPAGTFTADEGGARHSVKLTEGYWIGEVEVSQDLWALGAGNRPVEARCDASLVGGDLPVVCVDWCEAVAFANALSVRDGLQPVYGDVAACADSGTASVTWREGANGYRLATEAEWDRATETAAQDATACAPVSSLSGQASMLAGRGAPVCDGAEPENRFGVRALDNALSEWTWDWHAAQRRHAVDPTGPSAGAFRTAHGADRLGMAPVSRGQDLSLRLVRSVSAP
jgi:formylglycine-generating enzyme required for sulfatase activity